jgi:hypothetical protein
MPPTLAGTDASLVKPFRICRGVLSRSPESGIHNLYKFRLATPTGETRTVNVAIAPSSKVPCDRKADHHGRHPTGA